MDERWRLRAEASIRKDVSDLHRKILENVISRKAQSNFHPSTFPAMTRLGKYGIPVISLLRLEILDNLGEILVIWDVQIVDFQVIGSLTPRYSGKRFLHSTYLVLKLQ